MVIIQIMKDKYLNLVIINVKHVKGKENRAGVMALPAVPGKWCLNIYNICTRACTRRRDGRAAHSEYILYLWHVVWVICV